MEKIILSLKKFLDALMMALPKYITGLIILIVGFYVIKFIVAIIARRFAKREVDPSLRGFLLSLIRITLYVILFVIVIGIMGFQSLSLTAIFGAAGLTVGLALQGSLSNFAGGVLILLFRPFRVGDYISNSAGTTGTVEKIDLLYTTLKNDDGLKVFSPNGALANSVITNYSVIMSRRFSFTVGISYNANIKDAQGVIMKTIAGCEAVLKDPAPLVFVKNLGESSVDLSIVMWIGKESYWDTVFKIQQMVKDALDDAGIEIPFPQTDLHIVSDKTK